MAKFHVEFIWGSFGEPYESIDEFCNGDEVSKIKILETGKNGAINGDISDIW